MSNLSVHYVTRDDYLQEDKKLKEWLDDKNFVVSGDSLPGMLLVRRC
jgi:hypothetical protein